MDTSSWLSIILAVVAVLGSVGGTVVGVVITQRRSDRRDKLQWERTREIETARWAREDAMRTFERRQACYMEFEEFLRSAALAVYRAGFSPASQLDDDWKTSTYQSLLRMQVFATPEASKAGDHAYKALCRWGNHDSSDELNLFHEDEHAYDEAHAQYLSIIRRDLRVDSEESHQQPAVASNPSA